MKLAKFFIATSVNAAVTRRETSEDCVQTAQGCMSRSMTLGELDPVLLSLLLGGNTDSSLPLLAATGALGGNSNNALPILAATGALGDNNDALPVLAATGALGNIGPVATVALAGDDDMKAALPAAMMAQNAANGGSVAESLITATVLGADDMESNLNAAAIHSQKDAPDSGLATAALLSSSGTSGLGNLAPLALMNGGIDTNTLLTAQALRDPTATSNNNNLPLLFAAQGSGNNLLTAAALTGSEISAPLFLAAQSNNPAAAGIALATADNVSPAMSAIVAGAEPAKVMAATGQISNDNLALVAANEAGVNPFNYHLINSKLDDPATSILASKTNDPLATFALTQNPTLSMLTAANNGQDVSALLPALLINKNGNTANPISDASLALMAGTSGKVNPAALLLAGNAADTQAGKYMQIAIQGQAGNITPIQAAHISQKPVGEITDALIAANIKDPATSFHASGGDVDAIRLREGPEYIRNNPGLANAAVEAAAAENKPFKGLFHTGTPAGFLAAKDQKPGLAWGAAATGNPLLTYALTDNPVLAMMAGQQGNVLPKEPVKVDPATGIIAGNASPSLGFALTGDSNYLMMDKLIDANNADSLNLALVNAYNHPTPSQQDLWYGSIASSPQTAYALTGNPIIANMVNRPESKETLTNLAVSQQIADPWTAYAINKDPKMLFANSLGGNPLVNIAALNSDKPLLSYALTGNNPQALFYSSLFGN